eukprot:TRINITY_DN114056_c0_g1_i1.p1 TRINITY_DN114056_c0_g1~~TRINITY_DN114056_c0_g1_i1.p1  ORF type:complete len:471 (-),score=7.52 TRINITY_DN114056_c0_g1_i1:67-1479(-)
MDDHPKGNPSFCSVQTGSSADDDSMATSLLTEGTALIPMASVPVKTQLVPVIFWVKPWHFFAILLMPVCLSLAVLMLPITTETSKRNSLFKLLLVFPAKFSSLTCIVIGTASLFYPITWVTPFFAFVIFVLLFLLSWIACCVHYIGLWWYAATALMLAVPCFMMFDLQKRPTTEMPTIGRLLSRNLPIFVMMATGAFANWFANRADHFITSEGTIFTVVAWWLVMKAQLLTFKRGWRVFMVKFDTSISLTTLPGTSFLWAAHYLWVFLLNFYLYMLLRALVMSVLHVEEFIFLLGFNLLYDAEYPIRLSQVYIDRTDALVDKIPFGSVFMFTGNARQFRSQLCIEYYMKKYAEIMSLLVEVSRAVFCRFGWTTHDAVCKGLTPNDMTETEFKQAIIYFGIQCFMELLACFFLRMWMRNKYGHSNQMGTYMSDARFVLCLIGSACAAILDSLLSAWNVSPNTCVVPCVVKF